MTEIVGNTPGSTPSTLTTIQGNIQSGITNVKTVSGATLGGVSDVRNSINAASSELGLGNIVPKIRALSVIDAKVKKGLVLLNKANRIVGSIDNVQKTVNRVSSVFSKLTGTDPIKTPTAIGSLLQGTPFSKQSVFGGDSSTDGPAAGIVAGADNSGRTHLKRFTTVLGEVGIQRSNRFQIELVIPAALGAIMNKKYGTDLASRITLWAMDTNIPGYSSSSTDIRVGQVASVAASKYPSEYRIIFLASGDMLEHKFFVEWKDFIFKEDRSVAFYDDYISAHIGVKSKNEQNKFTEQMNMEEAWPMTVSDIQLNQGYMNEYTTFQVSFKFRNARLVPTK